MAHRDKEEEIQIISFDQINQAAKGLGCLKIRKRVSGAPRRTMQEKAEALRDYSQHLD